VIYIFKASKTFWRKFNKLSTEEKAIAKEKYSIFQKNPFDYRLGTHKINILSARAKRTIYSAEVAQDLRAVFYIEHNVVFTLDIGNHNIYK
jgi:hypothetical protein